MPLVSVIIPVYNVKQYLEECINSVRNQTLKNIEILCIDDGSTDGSDKILDYYAEEDDRIRVIHKENEGYGKAINCGFLIAAGKYIGIVESDDFILPDMFEALYKEAEADQLDFVKSAYYRIWNGEYKIYIRDDHMDSYYNRIIDDHSRMEAFDFSSYNWTGLYKREFLEKNNILHNETPGASYQDFGFWLQVMCMFQKAKWIDRGFYMYRQDNPESSVKSRAKMMAVLDECRYVSDILLSRSMIREWRCCNYFRMSKHKATFFRLDNSLRREYAYIIQKDYLELKDEIDYTDALIPTKKDDLDWIQRMSDNPERISKELIDIGNTLKQKLDQKEGIIIYGTGKRAISTFTKLQNTGYQSKIRYFVVTNRNKNSHFLGYPVKSINETAFFESRDVVMVAVKENSRAYFEILKELEHRNCNDYINTEYINCL